ncbi:MAG: protein-glutamate O-methyltransferase CheR, partial [Sulfurimonas sp.]|nr:protein-glutamate O-methyltransferase CheR [Sulfurimonas sp.]
DNFRKFKQTVLNDAKFFDMLFRAFSLNVSSFFRNPKTFKAIREELLPCIKNFPSIRVWSAGCSSGEEAYSIAIMLDEAGLLNKSQIYATDFNDTILGEAQNGLFSRDEFDKFKDNYIEGGGKESLEKYFTIEDDFVQIKQNIKDHVLFFKHNLVTDASINEFHLIFCRNVLIYFDKKLKKRVFDVIDDSLSQNGFLILGESEVLYNEYNYKVVGDKKTKIYQKGLL